MDNTGNGNAPVDTALQTKDQSLNTPEAIERAQTLQGNTGHVETQDRVTSQSDDSLNDDSELSVNAKREANKMAKLERERNELQKELEGLRSKASVLDVVDSVYKEDREAYEALRKSLIKKGHQDPGSYESLYASTSAPLQGSTSIDSDPEVLIARAKQEAVQEIRHEQARKEMEGVFGKFKEAYPDMDPDIMTPEQRQEAMVRFDALLKVASVVKVQNPERSLDEILIEEWQYMPFNRGKAIEKVQNKGEMIGRAKAYASGTGVTSGVSTGAQRQNDVSLNSLSADERALYDRVKEKSGKDVADRYARNVLGL